METAAISIIAGAVVSLLVAFLKRFAEEIAKGAGEEIGTSAGSRAWDKVEQLYEAIKARFFMAPETAEVIASFERSPDDSGAQAALRFHLEKMMATDEQFARTLVNGIRTASEAGADTLFQTTIWGDVQKLIQMGNVYGDVII